MQKISGIYAITNTVNGKLYYGSSVNIGGRKRQHWHSLKNGTHRNRHLQAAWNKYGESAFTFALVVEVPIDQLQAVEQVYLDGNVDGYNLAKCAECAPRGLKRTDDQKLKMSESRRGRKLSAEHRAKLSEAGKGRQPTEAQRRAISDRMKGKPLGVTARRKNSATMRRQWQDANFRDRILSAQNTGRQTESAKQNYSAAMKSRWNDPERSATLRLERKRRWDEPEYRSMMTEKRRIQGQKLRERNQLKRRT